MFGRSRLRRERGSRLPRNVFGLLAERERNHSASGLDIELLRWSAGEWVRQPHMSSDYCRLNAEAKSTIALAFSSNGVLFRCFPFTGWRRVGRLGVTVCPLPRIAYISSRILLLGRGVSSQVDA